jgi:hypothetical protein
VEPSQSGPIDRANLLSAEGVGVVAGVQTDTSSIYWAQLNKFHMKKAKESSLPNVVFEMKDRTMDNVQNCDSYDVCFCLSRKGMQAKTGRHYYTF